jgi:drug/metabolite transporter (DMT)-like permease
MFMLLGLLWGSSFLWIKVALQEIGPFTLVAYRLLLGVLGMALVVAWKRPAFPGHWQVWAQLALLGLFNTALPFVLISWGEQSIDSAMAAILNGTVPLFSLVLAHTFLKDDRITSGKVMGLVSGFFGVVLLTTRDLGTEWFVGGLWGKVAVMVAALSYAGSSVFARRSFPRLSPLVQALVSMAMADAFVWGVAPWFEGPLLWPASWLTWLALAWLGLLGSCLAYILYFSLLHAVGPSRTTMVTYVFPLVGVALGVIFLQERLDWRLALGSLLVLAGIAMANVGKRSELVAAAAD